MAEIPLPRSIGRPATGALAVEGITRLDQLSTWSERGLLALHGVGPKAVRLLREALVEHGLSLADGGAVWLVVGAQGAGKSTVAEGLAASFPRSVHVRGAQMYRWAVNGWAHPAGREPEGEARRLLDLRYRLSASVAALYAEAGFVAVVQDNIYADDVRTWLDAIPNVPRHLVVLRPKVEVVEARDSARRASTGKVAYQEGGPTAADLDAALGRIGRKPSGEAARQAQRPLGLWLDTSDQTPRETVAEILRRSSEAFIRR